jgi:hypothetical protein
VFSDSQNGSEGCLTPCLPNKLSGTPSKFKYNKNVEADTYKMAGIGRFSLRNNSNSPVKVIGKTDLTSILHKSPEGKKEIEVSKKLDIKNGIYNPTSEEQGVIKMAIMDNRLKS